MSDAKGPNIITQAQNFTAAMATWATHDNFGKVSDEVFNQRKDICTACPHWNQERFNGIGQCSLCGCSGFKLYIPSSKCPDKPAKW